MKKIIYFIPAIIFTAIYGFVLFIGADLELIAYIFWILLILSGILLSMKKWWGCLFGLSMGIWLMVMDLSQRGVPVIRQWPLGLVFSLFYIICGIMIYIDPPTKSSTHT